MGWGCWQLRGEGVMPLTELQHEGRGTELQGLGKENARLSLLLRSLGAQGRAR